MSYKQLSREQRYAISLGLKEIKSNSAIAQQIGCSVSTVCREIKRNSNRYGRYIYNEAQELAQIRRERSVSNRKIPIHIVHKALYLLKSEDWSPKQISGSLATQGINISHEKIYQLIRDDESGELRSHCRHKMKYRHQKGRKRKTAGRSLIPNRVSIHERPPEADGKRFGDWEMDLAIGKGQKSAVLTMVERSTNMFFQTKISSKKPDVVAKAAWRLLLTYKKYVLTITTDNGIEFMNHQWLSQRLDTTVYFANPFCSGQKGAIENANKLIRQYIPKGTDFSTLTDAFIRKIQHKINRRPREKLAFSTPFCEFFKNLQ